MSRHLIAAVSVTAVVVALVGCGGGGKPAATTRPVDTSSVKALCPTVLEVQKRYLAATLAMGLRFEDKRLEAPARKSLEELLLRVGQLQLIASDSQRRTIAPLFVALSNQLVTLKALVQHDLKTAARYGKSINAPLQRGMVDLRKLCAHPS